MQPHAENNRLLDGYLSFLGQRLSRHAGYVLPGIIRLLDALRERKDCVVALLTGNLVRGAEIKLSHTASGTISSLERLLMTIMSVTNSPDSRARALEKHGEEFSPENIFVIGDTPRDIECGKFIGAKTVAIATGNYSRDQLAAHHRIFSLKTFRTRSTSFGALGE